MHCSKVEEIQREPSEQKDMLVLAVWVWAPVKEGQGLKSLGCLQTARRPPTRLTQGRLRPTNNSMTGWNHSLESIPPALLNMMSGVESGTVVSGEPQRGQYPRRTFRPLDPTSSNWAISPVIVTAARWTKMIVENALRDCGRQRSQWQRAAAKGCSAML
jgi:hypothetical protein